MQEVYLQYGRSYVNTISSLLGFNELPLRLMTNGKTANIFHLVLEALLLTLEAFHFLFHVLLLLREGLLLRQKTLQFLRRKVLGVEDGLLFQCVKARRVIGHRITERPVFCFKMADSCSKFFEVLLESGRVGLDTYDPRGVRTSLLESLVSVGVCTLKLSCQDISLCLRKAALSE